MPFTLLRATLPVSLLFFAIACSAPVEPVLELPAPIVQAPARLEAREGVAFSHELVIVSEAPPVTLKLEGAPVGLGLEGTVLGWTPDFDQAGEHVVTVVATDAQPTPRTTRHALTIVVENVNRAPTKPALATTAAFPIRAGESAEFTATAEDADKDELTFTWAVSDEAWTVTANGAAATVTTAVPGSTAVLTVTASDGIASASETFELRARPNAAPENLLIATTAAFPVRAGESAEFTATAEDADEDELTFTWAVSDEAWTVTANGASATVTTAVPDLTAVLTVTVSDGLASTSASFELGSKANAIPTVTFDEAAATTLLATKTMTLAAQAFDADGDELTWTWSVSDDAWTVTEDGSTATVTAPRAVDAEVVVTVTVTDGWGGEATATHTLTTTGVQVSGTVDFLQNGTFSIEAPGGERVDITANGAFEFKTTRLVPGTPRALAFPTQPPGQRCALSAESAGEVGDEDVELSVVCSLIAQSKVPVTSPLSTTSKTYAPVPGVEPLSFSLSKPAHALVTLSVPHAVGDPVYGTLGKVWVAVTVDDLPVGEAVWQNADWSQGGPLGVVTTVPLSAGEHTVKAVWKVGDRGASASIPSFGSVVLTATVVESLPFGRGGARVEASFEGQSAPQSPEPLPLPALAFANDALVLASAQVADVLTDGSVSFHLMNGTLKRAEGTFHHAGTAHAVPLASLFPVEAGDELTLNWSTNATALPGEAPIVLSAGVFDAGITHRTATDSTLRGEAKTTFQRVLANEVPTLTLTEEKSVLLLFQAPSAFVGGNGYQGEIAIRVNDDVVSLARVQSQNSSVSSPLVMSAIVRLPVGAHTLDVAFRSVSGGQSVFLSAGLRSLVAIVLD